MPELSRRKLRDRSVRNALTEMRRDLLPTPIREDELANWVLAFDDLRSTEEPRHSDNGPSDEQPYRWALEVVVSSALQRQMPFYFASLFQIGRQWAVSERTLENLQRAGREKNLYESARMATVNFTKGAERNPRLAALADASPRSLADGFSLIFKTASEQQSKKRAEAENWWNTWRDEVRYLKQRVDSIQERAYRRFDNRSRFDERLWPDVAALTVQGSRPSRLRARMESSGIRLRIPTTENWYHSISEVFVPLAVAMFASSKDYGPDLHFFWHELRHVFYDVHRESRYGPLRDTALEHLRSIQGSGPDPFSSYLPLRKPASEELRTLVIQHRLPGDENSPWLQSWLGCLDTSPTSGVTSTRMKPNDPEFIRALARSADSNIKHNLTEPFQLGESWQVFVQRLFEFKWVQEFSSMLVSTNAGQGVPMWTFDICFGAITATVAILNETGYTLIVPSADRLKDLWERLTNKEHIKDW